MISTPKTEAVVVGGHSSVQCSGHLPVRQLESLAADIAESDINISLMDASEIERQRIDFAWPTKRWRIEANHEKLCGRY